MKITRLIKNNHFGVLSSFFCINKTIPKKLTPIFKKGETNHPKIIIMLLTSLLSIKSLVFVTNKQYKKRILHINASLLTNKCQRISIIEVNEIEK